MERNWKEKSKLQKMDKVIIDAMEIGYNKAMLDAFDNDNDNEKIRCYRCNKELLRKESKYMKFRIDSETAGEGDFCKDCFRIEQTKNIKKERPRDIHYEVDQWLAPKEYLEGFTYTREGEHKKLYKVLGDKALVYDLGIMEEGPKGYWNFMIPLEDVVNSLKIIDASELESELNN